MEVQKRVDIFYNPADDQMGVEILLDKNKPLARLVEQFRSKVESLFPGCDKIELCFQRDYDNDSYEDVDFNHNNHKDDRFSKICANVVLQQQYNKETREQSNALLRWVARELRPMAEGAFVYVVRYP